MKVIDCIDYVSYIYYIFISILFSIFIYNAYYKFQYEKISNFGNKKFLYIISCWLEEILILAFIIPGALLISIGLWLNINVTYQILNNNHKDLLIASLTVFSITTAISLICINFEKNVFSKFIFESDLPMSHNQQLVKNMLFKIKLFSSGYKHLWISTILIAYTLWILLCLSDNTLTNGQIHYFIWWKLIIVNGVSFMKTLIEFSFLSSKI